MRTKMTLETDDDAEVQMGPLIDCVFLLLIFFLVASTLKKAHQEIPMVQPQMAGVTAPKQPQDYVVIQIGADHSVYINGTLAVRSTAAPKDADLFRKQLAELARIEPRPSVRIDVERNSVYQDMMFVSDACYKAGFPKVGVHMWTRAVEK